MSKNKSNNKFGKDKFKSQDNSKRERSRDTRDERKVKEDYPKILFSFKDFDRNQGQSYADWEEEKLLSALVEKIGYLSEMTMNEAKRQEIITEYGSFPSKSDFKHPKHIVDDVSWAVIKNVKGQAGRVAGHIIENIFYVVFFDKGHRFYVTEKKNT
jgi:hypothetical protein